MSRVTRSVSRHQSQKPVDSGENHVQEQEHYQPMTTIRTRSQKQQDELFGSPEHSSSSQQPIHTGLLVQTQSKSNKSCAENDPEGFHQTTGFSVKPPKPVGFYTEYFQSRLNKIAAKSGLSIVLSPCGTIHHPNPSLPPRLPKMKRLQFYRVEQISFSTECPAGTLLKLMNTNENTQTIYDSLGNSFTTTISYSAPAEDTKPYKIDVDQLMSLEWEELGGNVNSVDEKLKEEIEPQKEVKKVRKRRNSLDLTAHRLQQLRTGASENEEPNQDEDGVFEDEDEYDVEEELEQMKLEQEKQEKQENIKNNINSEQNIEPNNQSNLNKPKLISLEITTTPVPMPPVNTPIIPSPSSQFTTDALASLLDIHSPLKTREKFDRNEPTISLTNPTTNKSANPNSSVRNNTINDNPNNDNRIPKPEFHLAQFSPLQKCKKPTQTTANNTTTTQLQHPQFVNDNYNQAINLDNIDNDTIPQFRTQINTLSLENSQKSEQNAILSDQITALAQQNEDLKAQLSILTAQFNAVQLELQTTTHSLTQLKSQPPPPQLIDNSDDIKELEGIIEEMKQACRTKSCRGALLVGKDLTKKDKLISINANHLKEYGIKAEKLSTELEEFRVKVQVLEGEKEGMEKDNIELRRVNEELERKVAGLENTKENGGNVGNNDVLNEKSDHWMKLLKEKDDVIDGQKSELDKLKRNEKKFNEQEKLFQGKVANFEASIIRYQNDMEGYQQQLDLTQEEREEEIQQLQIQFENQLEKVTIEKDKLTKKYENELKKVCNENEKLIEKYENSEESLSVLTTQYDDLQSDYDNLNDQYSTLLDQEKINQDGRIGKSDYDLLLSKFKLALSQLLTTRPSIKTSCIITTNNGFEHDSDMGVLDWGVNGGSGVNGVNGGNGGNGGNGDNGVNRGDKDQNNNQTSSPSDHNNLTKSNNRAQQYYVRFSKHTQPVLFDQICLGETSPNVGGQNEELTFQNEKTPNSNQELIEMSLFGTNVTFLSTSLTHGSAHNSTNGNEFIECPLLSQKTENLIQQSLFRLFSTLNSDVFIQSLRQNSSNSTSIHVPSKSTTKYTIKLSVYELYMEKLRDLLAFVPKNQLENICLDDQNNSELETSGTNSDDDALPNQFKSRIQIINSLSDKEYDPNDCRVCNNASLFSKKYSQFHPHPLSLHSEQSHAVSHQVSPESIIIDGIRLQTNSLTEAMRLIRAAVQYRTGNESKQQCQNSSCGSGDQNEDACSCKTPSFYDTTPTARININASHIIIQCRLVQVTNTGTEINPSEKHLSTVSFVDLSHGFPVNSTLNPTIYQEMSSITSSLTALMSTIQQIQHGKLVQMRNDIALGQSLTQSDQLLPHQTDINYRMSKLTMILKDSLTTSPFLSQLSLHFSFFQFPGSNSETKHLLKLAHRVQNSIYCEPSVVEQGEKIGGRIEQNEQIAENRDAVSSKLPQSTLQKPMSSSSTDLTTVNKATTPQQRVTAVNTNPSSIAPAAAALTKKPPQSSTVPAAASSSKSSNGPSTLGNQSNTARLVGSVKTQPVGTTPSLPSSNTSNPATRRPVANSTTQGVNMTAKLANNLTKK